MDEGTYSNFMFCLHDNNFLPPSRVTYHQILRQKMMVMMIREKCVFFFSQVNHTSSVSSGLVVSIRPGGKNLFSLSRRVNTVAATLEMMGFRGFAQGHFRRPESVVDRCRTLHWFPSLRSLKGLQDKLEGGARRTIRNERCNKTFSFFLLDFQQITTSSIFASSVLL